MLQFRRVNVAEQPEKKDESLQAPTNTLRNETFGRKHFSWVSSSSFSPSGPIPGNLEEEASRRGKGETDGPGSGERTLALLAAVSLYGLETATVSCRQRLLLSSLVQTNVLNQQAWHSFLRDGDLKARVSLPLVRVRSDLKLCVVGHPVVSLRWGR